MDKKEALKIVQVDGLELEDLPDHFKKDKKIVLEAIKNDEAALEFAHDSLKNDPDILAIVNKDK
jgi:hypothetical protein